MANQPRSKTSRRHGPLLEELVLNLHDTVAQDLTAAALLADLIATKLRGERHQDTALAAALVEKINATTTQLQKIMRRLPSVNSHGHSAKKTS
jgi:hypothetical protein